MVDRRTVIVVSLLIMFVSLLLVGPTQVLQSDSVTLIFIGIALNGFGIAGVFVPVMPELVDAVAEELIIADNADTKRGSDESDSGELLESNQA